MKVRLILEKTALGYNQEIDCEVICSSTISTKTPILCNSMGSIHTEFNKNLMIAIIKNNEIEFINVNSIIRVYTV